MRRGRWVAVPLLAGLAIVIGARALAPDPCTGTAVDAAERPTIVVVVFDDLDVALAEAMPTWDDVSARGASFTNAFVTSPLCCPSRVSILAGQYAHTHGVYDNGPPTGGYERAAELDVQSCALPVWLDRAGYETVMIGRYLNGHGRFTVESKPPGWDDWQAMLGGRYRGYRLDDNGEVVRPERHATDEIADRAVRALTAERDAPLFLLVSPTAPHTPLDPAHRHAWAVPRDGVDPGRYRLMLGGMDLVARVLGAVPDDAFFVLTSDNGFHTEPTWGKGTPWDSDTRVPLLVSGPGLAPGERDELVANIDLAPTIAAWAGIRPPESVDGASLGPLLRREEKVDWREELTLELVGEWTAVRTRHDVTVTWSDGRVERTEGSPPPAGQ